MAGASFYGGQTSILSLYQPWFCFQNTAVLVLLFNYFIVMHICGDVMRTILMFFIGILACSTGIFAEDVPVAEVAVARHAAAAPSREAFFAQLNKMENRVAEYEKIFASRRRRAGAMKNRFTPELYTLAEELLSRYGSDVVKEFYLSVSEKKDAINRIFFVLEHFRKRGNNSSLDRCPLAIPRCARYRLAQYCFEAFPFESYDDGGRFVDSHVICIIKAFNSVMPAVKSQSLYLCMALADWLEAHRCYQGFGGGQINSAIRECREIERKLLKIKKIATEQARKRRDARGQ